jgi:hypothetical protein
MQSKAPVSGPGSSLFPPLIRPRRTSAQWWNPKAPMLCDRSFMVMDTSR